MKSPNPASLQNLNDIVMPDGIDWWPLAAGWYGVLVLVFALVGWLAYRYIHRWINNRYRREAMHEIERLGAQIATPEMQAAGLRQLPVLMKRTALSVFPRSEVAALSGVKWISFLNACVRQPVFSDDTARMLDRVSYSTGSLDDIDASEARALLDACKAWLKHHEPPSRPAETGRH